MTDFNAYIRGIVDVQSFLTDPATSPWRTHSWVAIGQGFLVGVSLLDFTIYTLNFLYGLSLAIPRFRGLGKIMPFIVGILFLSFRFL